MIPISLKHTFSTMIAVCLLSSLPSSISAADRFDDPDKGPVWQRVEVDPDPPQPQPQPQPQPESEPQRAEEDDEVCARQLVWVRIDPSSLRHQLNVGSLVVVRGGAIIALEPARAAGSPDQRSDIIRRFAQAGACVEGVTIGYPMPMPMPGMTGGD